MATGLFWRCSSPIRCHPKRPQPIWSMISWLNLKTLSFSTQIPLSVFVFGYTLLQLPPELVRCLWREPVITASLPWRRSTYFLSLNKVGFYLRHSMFLKPKMGYSKCTQLFSEISSPKLETEQAVKENLERHLKSLQPQMEQILREELDKRLESPQREMEKAVREDLERRSVIYNKGKGGIITTHMKITNEAAKEIAIRNPKLMEKGRRADLMEEAASIVRKTFQFKNGYSSSKVMC